MELLSAITNSVLSITRQVIFDVKKCGAYMRMVVMTLVNRVESGKWPANLVRGRCSQGRRGGEEQGAAEGKGPTRRALAAGVDAAAGKGPCGGKVRVPQGRAGAGGKQRRSLESLSCGFRFFCYNRCRCAASGCGAVW